MNFIFWRVSSYTPKYLGFDFPEIKRITIGICGAKNKEHQVSLGVTSDIGFSLGHAHICKKDKSYLTVCIVHKDYIKDIKGKPSNIMLHEYAHILDTAHHINECVVHSNWDQKIAQDYHHSDTFYSILGRLENDL